MTTVNLVSVGMQGPAGPPGPAGSGGGTYLCTIATSGPYGGPQASGPLTLLGGSELSGGATVGFGVPVWAYPPGLIIIGMTVAIEDIPPSTDSFDLGVIVSVVSIDGTNVIYLGGGLGVAANGESGGLGLNDLSISGGQIGSDLTWDPNAGLSTIAGGAYGITFTMIAQWD